MILFRAGLFFTAIGNIVDGKQQIFFT